MRLLFALLSLSILKIVVSAPQYNGQQVTQNVPRYVTKLSPEQIKRLQDERGFGPTVSSFRPTTVAYEEEYDDEDNSPASSQSVAAPPRAPVYEEQDNYPFRNSLQQGQTKGYSKPQIQQPQQFKASSVKRLSPQQFRPQLLDEDSKAKLEEEKELEEPDRLSILLPQSKFNCNGKNTGYYADEGLGCEVFHYCQDNSKHSWICPEGFTFHQVHLICMPPGNDNICEKSSQYHFINEYLYKPVNLEEHQTKPNISLRYSERYYPDKFHYQEYEYDEEEEQQQPISHNKQPVRILQHTPVTHQQQQQLAQRRPAPASYAPTLRADTSGGQVFRSPEEVNISLQQRRPAFISQRYVTPELQYQ